MHNDSLTTEALEHGSGRALDDTNIAGGQVEEGSVGFGTAYGYRIQADFPLTRLAADGPAERGLLRLRHHKLPRAGLLEIGRDPDPDGPGWILERCPNGLVVRSPGLGGFLIDPPAGVISYEPEDDGAVGPEWEHRILCTAVPQLLAARGDLVIHAAGMVFAERAVAFCGPSFAGKSTVAIALARRGFELLSEDGLVVSGLPHSPLAWPGPDGIRVRERSGNTSLRRSPEIRLRRAPAALAAIVIMGARKPGATAVLGIGSAVAAAAIARSAAFVGESERRRVLALATATAATVPAYVLRASDDLQAFAAAADDLARHVVALLT